MVLRAHQWTDLLLGNTVFMGKSSVPAHLSGSIDISQEDQALGGNPCPAALHLLLGQQPRAPES